MKISVVMPTYNEEKYIKKCLDSLKDQDYKNYELIVVLNNCTDNTGSIVKKYKGIRIVEEKKKGVTYARQKGTLLATGEVIASVDADSFYPKNWLSQIACNFKKDNILGLYGPVYLESDSLFLRFMARYVYTLFLRISSFLGKDNAAGINFAFRKDLYDKVNGYTLNLRSAEDIDLANKIGKFGKIKFDRELVVFTSDRKFKGRFFKSLFYHSKNYIRMFLLKKKPKEMIDIR
jgi:glycosyltransferase involved in cell wall biosynthesis